MTTGAKRVFRYPDSPFAIPDKCLNPASTVIPAKAGIQEGGAGGGMDGRFYRMARMVVVRVVIPAQREWVVYTTGFRPAPE